MAKRNGPRKRKYTHRQRVKAEARNLRRFISRAMARNVCPVCGAPMLDTARCGDCGMTEMAPTGAEGY